MKCLVLVLCLTTVSSYSQKAPFLPDSIITALVEELSGEEAKRNLEYISTLHRQRGSRAFKSAVTFITNKLGEYGLEEIEAFTIPADGKSMYGTQKSRLAWDAESAELWELRKSGTGFMPSVKLADYQSMPIVLAEDSESGEVTAELIDVGAGSSDSDYRGKAITGKLILTSSSPGAVIEMAVGKYGAAGILSYAQNQRTAWWKEDTNIIRWGHLDGFAKTKGFAFMLSLKQGTNLAERLQQGEQIMLKATVNAGQRPGNYDFVTAVIKGSDGTLKDQEIAFTCHLDHQRPGANDNASGSVTILEIARALEKLIAEKKIPRPKRTIRFIWSPEIEGTSAILSQRPRYATIIKAVVHMDMVGGGQVTKSIFHIAGSQKSLPSFVADIGAAFGDFVNSETDHYASGYSHNFPLISKEGGKEPLQATIGEFHLGSDHEIYGEASYGIPFIYLHDWPDRYIHTNFDVPANIDPTKLLRAAFIGAASAYTLSTLNPSNAAPLISVMEEQALERTANTRKNTASLSTIDAGNVWIHHFRFERDVFESAKSFVAFSTADQQLYKSFLAGLEQAMGMKTFAAATLKEGVIYQRNPGIKGPMSVFGYNYLADHLGAEKADALQLGNYMDKGEYYTYEALNFVDGKKTVSEIRDALSAEFGSVPFEMVDEYLKALENIGVLKKTEKK